MLEALYLNHFPISPLASYRRPLWVPSRRTPRPLFSYATLSPPLLYHTRITGYLIYISPVHIQLPLFDLLKLAAGLPSALPSDLSSSSFLLAHIIAKNLAYTIIGSGLDVAHLYITVLPSPLRYLFEWPLDRHSLGYLLYPSRLPFQISFFQSLQVRLKLALPTARASLGSAFV